MLVNLLGQVLLVIEIQGVAAVSVELQSLKEVLPSNETLELVSSVFGCSAKGIPE